MNQLFQRLKSGPAPATFVTVYDAAFARLAESAGAAGLIIGDTVGPLALGLSSPAEVDVEMMCHHAAAVRRGSTIPVIADVPLGLLETGEDNALQACARLAGDTRVDALKIEGASAPVLKLIRRLVDGGHTVAAHLEGDRRPCTALIDDARRVAQAGVSTIVLVSVDAGDAATITRSVGVPTIGKNSGPDCDAQVVNAYQTLGLVGPDSPLRTMLESAIANSSNG